MFCIVFFGGVVTLKTPPCLSERHLSPPLREGYLFQNAQVIPGPHTGALQGDPHQSWRLGTESVA